MKTIGYALLALLLWWALSIIITAGGTPLLTGGTLPRDDAFLYAGPAVLVVGSVYALPVVLYLAGADALARWFAFPRNIAVYLALLMVGSVPLFGLTALLSGSRIRTSLDDPEWVVIPTLAVAALYMSRQMRRRGAPQAA